jgi:hypothetical protein
MHVDDRMKTLISLSLLVAACSHEPATRSPATPPSPAQMQVNAAQQESEQAYASAREAQKQANQKTRDAADAQRDAQQKQLEAQQAEQRSAQLQQEAQIAQQQAIIAGREASRRAQSAQERALELQPRAQSQISQQAPLTTVSGTIKSVNGNEIVIARPGAAPMHLSIDPQHTTALRSGQEVSAQHLREGVPVTVQYRVENGQPVAQIIAEGGTTDQNATSQNENDQDNTNENPRR